MSNINLIKSLNEKNPDYAKCHGITSLSTIGGCNASRGNMMANNMHQTMTLVEPEPPKVLSGSENMFGRLSDGYKKLDGTWEVVDKIQKFKDSNIYCLVLYNKETNEANIIENPFAENGPERFGYLYNTKTMDNHKIGDTFTDEVIYKSTSYDDDMNYNMGVNARVVYLTGSSTIEDGFTINADWAKKVKIPQVNSFKVSINDNDIPIFVHDYDGEHHPIPKIGQQLSTNVVCAIRRVNSRRVPYDYTEEALTHISPSDKTYKCDANSIIYDMNIYYNNKSPFPETAFFKDLAGLYYQQCAYYRAIHEKCIEFEQKGVKLTQNTLILHKTALAHIDVMDNDYKWVDKDSAFSNMVIEFKYYSITSLYEGYKAVGRYGNKGVVSEIRGKNPENTYQPNTEFDKMMAKILGIDGAEIPRIQFADSTSMMYDDKGRVVDIYYNAPGGYRRENTDQLCEVEITFIAECIQDKMETMDSLQEQFDLAFDFIEHLADVEYRTFIDYLGVKVKVTKDDKHYITSKKKMQQFVDSIIKNGFYIYNLPHENIRYDKICNFYDRYPFIERRQMYVDKFGLKKIPVRHKMVVGYQYMFILKQTTNKNFSARSMGRLSRIGIPAKSVDKKENRTNISDTPLNRGETYNLFIDLDAVDIAISDLFTRNSPVARKDLKRIISEPGDPFRIRDWKIKDSYVNVNVQNFKARLKTLGIGYELVTDRTIRAKKLYDYESFIPVYKYTFFDYGRNRKFYFFIVNEYNRIMRTGTDDDKENVWDIIKETVEYKKVNPPEDVFRTVMETITTLNSYQGIDAEINDDMMDE